MRKAIALILVLTMALTFCACGKDSSQTPTAPDTTPTPEAANTPAPQESEVPADEPEKTPEPAPEATPEAAPGENIREEGFTDSGTPIVYEYSAETGELLKIEFYSDDGAIDSIQYFEHDVPAMQVDYRPDGQIDTELYFENDEVIRIVSYNYDADGNLIDTHTEDLSYPGGDEDPGYNDVQTEEYGDGSYTETEYDACGMPVYSAYYDASGILISETIFENGMVVLINSYENNELIHYEQYAYDGHELVWSGFYNRTAGGEFVLESEQHYSSGQPVTNDQPTGGDRPSEPQSGGLPELSEYEYANMRPGEVEAAFAANGFTVTRNDSDYVHIVGFVNETPRASISMSGAGEYLPWYNFTHEADDSSAPMDIGLRGIKTHDSMRTVMQKLGMVNIDAIANKLEELYESNDIDLFLESIGNGVLEAYTEDVKTIFYTSAITGDSDREFDQIGIGIDYMAADYYFCVYFYFEDGILVDVEFM